KLSAIQSRLLRDSLDCDNQRILSMYARADTCADSELWVPTFPWLNGNVTSMLYPK
ncbi:9196_t:CDS:1, partial [Funneliformis geosporum]